MAGDCITALRHILLVPLFLRAWSSPVYGEWLTVYALVGYLTLFDMGLYNYVINRLTQSHSKGNRAEYTRVFQSALRLYLAVLGFAFIIFVIFVVLFAFNTWLNIAVTSPATVKATALIFGSYFLLRILAGFLFGLYNSFGEYPRKAILNNLYELTLLSLLVAALYMREGFIIVSSLHFIPLLAFSAYALFDIQRRHKEVSLGFAQADWGLSLRFIAPSLLFLLIILAYALKVQGSILIIGGMIGASAVAVFSVHRTLANLIVKLVISVRTALQPELTAAEARRDYKRMQRAFDFLVKLSLFLSVSFAVSLFFAGGDIIRIWTHGAIEFQPLLWMILLVYLPLNTFWETCGIFQISTNRHRLYAGAITGSAVFGTVFAVVLTRTWGVVGTLTGFLATETLICGILIPSETLRIIKADKKRFWLGTLGRTAMALVAQAAAGWLVATLVEDAVIRIILVFVGVFFAGLVVNYVVCLRHDEKEALKTGIMVLRRRLFSC